MAISISLCLILLLLLILSISPTCVNAAPTNTTTKDNKNGGKIIKKKKEAHLFTFDFRSAFNVSNKRFSMKKASVVVSLICAIALAAWFIIGMVCACGLEGGLRRSIYR